MSYLTLRSVITGASSGIGLELSRLLCREYGARVVGVGRNESRLNDVSKELGECFNYVVSDLSSLQGVDKVVTYVAKVLDGVDLLVNNAGFGLNQTILNHSDDDVLSMIMTNFVAPIILTKRLVPIMSRDSTVVMVITAGIHVLMRNLPVYGASKIALHYVSEALRSELKEFGIHLLAVYPGIVKTEFHVRAGTRIEGGINPQYVAKEILKAVKKRRSKLYIPWYISLVRLLGPHLVIHYGR